jgi:Leucine-rich repeat (LRR) protein
MLKLFRQLAVALAIAMGCVLLVTSAIGEEPASAASTPATARSQDTPAIHEILNRCEESLAGLKTYDVNFTQTMAFPMKTVIVVLESPSRPGITKTSKWIPLSAGEVPIVHTNRFRQVWSRSGQQRVDVARSHGPPSKSTLVNNGNTLRSLSTTAGQTSGSVQASGRLWLPSPEDYATYLRGEFANLIPILRHLGEHSGARLLAEHEGLPGILLPASEFKDFRVWFDPQHGFLPRRVEIWLQGRDDAEPRLRSRMEVVRYHQPQPGVWVPVEMDFTNFNPEPGAPLEQPVSFAHVAVDVEKSQWNGPLDEALFVLHFPPGMEVTDAIDELRLIAGEGDDGQSLDLLVKNAVQKQKIEPATRTPRLDLAKVRQQDAAIAKLLLEYDAIITLDDAGAVTQVAFDAFQFGREPGVYSPIIDNSLLPKIAKLDKLLYLGLNHTQVTDEGLKQLAGLKNLKQLSLQCTKITDEGIKNLAPLTGLEWLWLDNNFLSDGKPVKFVSFTDAGLANLAPLQNLTHLQLVNTDITDAGLKHLKALPRIEQMSIKGTGVTPAGAKGIQAEVPSLQYID